MIQMSAWGLVGQEFESHPAKTNQSLKNGYSGSCLAWLWHYETQDWLARCQYTVTGWGIQVVLDSTSLCGSTQINVQLAPS